MPGSTDEELGGLASNMIGRKYPVSESAGCISSLGGVFKGIPDDEQGGPA
jgi:hypothetical protein